MTAQGPAMVPRQLPRTIARLVGRRAELDELNGLLKDSSGSTDGGASPIFLITGTAGVGKTSLAVWWAQQAAEEFPDGQLYADLRGFEHGAQPTTPDEALRGFLDAFEVPPHKIPNGLSAQSALYRSLLAGRRVLVVLDNAHNAAQVRPLLPGSSGCIAIVTSRIDPMSLVAIEGAHLQTLPLLTRSEAQQLLRDRLGDSPVGAEPAAVDRIIDSCARLPLALAVVAARATVEPATLSTIAEELRSVRRRLDALTVGNDSGADVRGTLSWSYRALSPDAARMFRLLGLHPGPDFDVYAAASLAGITVGRALSLLSDLARAHLISEQPRGRYNLHDLLREYANELVTADGDLTNRPAVLRMITHYLDVALVANRLMDPHRDARTRLVEPEPAPTLDPPHDAAQAQTWFRAEHRVLIRTVDIALRSGMERHAWQLAWTLSTYLDREGHWRDWANTMTAALDAADRLGHQAAQAIAHRTLAHARVQQDRLDEAATHLDHALRLFHELGDTASQAATHNSMGGICDLQGRHQDALDHAQEALCLFETAGDAIGQAHAFNSVGWCQARLGHHDLALVSCERSRVLLEELDDQFGQATALDSIGFIHHETGNHRNAIACYERALALFRTAADRFYESEVLGHLGDCYRDLGDFKDAREAWQEALAILDDLGHPAESVRDKLVEVDELS